MYYSENRDQAGEYLRLTLGIISKYNLPADPTCYSVWYEYISGNNQPLKKAIDHTIESQKPITVSTVNRFYQTYIADKNRAMTEKLLKEVKEILTDISRYVLATKGELTGHGDRLENLAKELDQAEDLETISAAVDHMIQEAKSLVQSGKHLQGRMTTSSEELASLRRQLEQSRQEAKTDALTGLLNRRGFEERLHTAMAASQSTSAPFSIIMIDLDHFKRVNDTYGHLVGDSILKAFAAMLKQQVKGKDTPARFGGEEFIIMLPDTRLAQARAVAENLRVLLATREWKHKESGRAMGRITISLGISQYRSPEPEKALIRRADTALYAAKQGGRNRVITEDQLPAPALRKEPATVN
ncbi:MAG: GGDEF domain-containing protein [Desulfobacteraceae bacterium]|nr:GGDEF domain-containing protein [Desulfobacteraceae bacterium]